MQTLFDYLEQFQRLSDADKQAIRAICSIKQVRRQEIIEAVGSSARTIYFLKTGIARTFYLSRFIQFIQFSINLIGNFFFKFLSSF